MTACASSAFARADGYICSGDSVEPKEASSHPVNPNRAIAWLSSFTVVNPAA